MVDDTKNCDDVADYLRATFPLLKNGTFVIHTKDNTKDATGEISENTARGKQELEKLRSLVNTVDDFTSPIRAIVSVLMLKEGWDVKNVTTIVGLRVSATSINDLVSPPFVFPARSLIVPPCIFNVVASPSPPGVPDPLRTKYRCCSVSCIATDVVST